MSRTRKNNFSVVYEEYLVFKESNIKHQTFASMKHDFNKRILPFFKDYNLEDITKKTVLEWKNYILSFNFTNNYNKHLYYYLSGFFEYCKINYNFNKAILTDVGCFKKKYEEDKHDFYSPEEFSIFIRCVENEVYKQFFNVMFFTGTRPGEAMALKFSDIQGNYLCINKTIDSHDNRTIGTPKTSTSNRKIIIDNKLRKDLLKLKKYYYDKFGSFDNSYFIFGGIKPLAPTTINRYMLKACKKCKLRKITLHQFRHSHATSLLNEHVQISVISKRLGHSDISTTLNTYIGTDLKQEKRVQRTLKSLRLNFLQILTNKVKSIIIKR